MFETVINFPNEFSKTKRKYSRYDVFGCLICPAIKPIYIFYIIGNNKLCTRIWKELFKNAQ